MAVAEVGSSQPRRQLTAGAVGAQAFCADVSMSVCTADGPSPCSQARIGLKQGCPLSSTFFGLYQDDFEDEVMAAAHAGGAAGPAQPDATVVVVDDMDLLATSAAELAAAGPAAGILPAVGLTVETGKTKVQSLGGLASSRGSATAVRWPATGGGPRLHLPGGIASPARAKAAGAQLPDPFFPRPYGPPGGLSSYCSIRTGVKPASQPVSGGAGGNR